MKPVSKWLTIFSVVGMAVGCGDDSSSYAPEPLPVDPQIMTNPEAGYLTFTLTKTGRTQTNMVLATNGGQKNLVFSSVRIEGRDAARFSIGEIDPSNLSVASRQYLAVPLTFTPNAQGVAKADLILESNATNNAKVVVELFGLGTTQNVPCSIQSPGCLPVLASVDSLYNATATAAEPMARILVRYFNVGGAPLEIKNYRLANNAASAFAIPMGTANPGSPCTTSQQCNADLACVTENTTKHCASFWVSGGYGVGMLVDYVPPAAGTHTAQLQIDTNMASPTVSLDLHGVR